MVIQKLVYFVSVEFQKKQHMFGWRMKTNYIQL